MSYFQAKTLLALFFMTAGVTAAVSMLTLMGRSERRLGVVALRNTHRTAGYVFAGILVVAAVMGLGHLGTAGDGLALRGVIHWVTASLLVVVLGLKIVIARFYKQFLKFVPLMGLVVFSLAFVVVVVSAVFFLVAGIPAGAGPPTAALEDRASTAEAAPAVGDHVRGEELFERHCAVCHHADLEDPKIGPGLAGLLARDQLPRTGKPATPATVLQQIIDPSGTMPSFEGILSDGELVDLVAYLKRL